MLKKRIMAKVTAVTHVTKDVASLWVKVGDVAGEARPGQFVALYCKDGARLLPRPISICEIDKRDGLLRLVFRIVGKGTKEFGAYRIGDAVPLMGPLGNGFPLSGEKALIIGGGIGIPPMLELAKTLDAKKHIVLGYRDETFLEDEFIGKGKRYLSTEDGSAGTKGTVLDAVWENDLSADVIYACGPKPMLRGIQGYAKKMGIPAWLSMEEHMACGIGACLACTCRSVEIDDHSRVRNKRICKDGPVFLGSDIVF